MFCDFEHRQNHIRRVDDDIYADAGNGCGRQTLHAETNLSNLTKKGESNKWGNTAIRHSLWGFRCDVRGTGNGSAVYIDTKEVSGRDFHVRDKRKGRVRCFCLSTVFVSMGEIRIYLRALSGFSISSLVDLTY